MNNINITDLQKELNNLESELNEYEKVLKRGKIEKREKVEKDEKIEKKEIFLLAFLLHFC